MKKIFSIVFITLLLSACNRWSSVDQFIQAEQKDMVSEVVSKTGQTSSINEVVASIAWEENQIEEVADDIVSNLQDTSEEKEVLRYQEFSKTLLTQSLQNSKTIVIHFYDENSLVDQSFRKNALFDKEKIPANVIILARPYQAEDVLVKKYQVKAENTFIFVDETLNEQYRMSKWIVKLETILKRLP